MLRENSQMRVSLSPYSGIYDAVVPQDHLLRKIKDTIDFSFVNPMLKNNIARISVVRRKSRR